MADARQSGVLPKPKDVAAQPEADWFQTSEKLNRWFFPGFARRFHLLPACKVIANVESDYFRNDLPNKIDAVRRDIETTPPGAAQDQLRRKLRRPNTAMQADKWAASPELKPPT